MYKIVQIILVAFVATSGYNVRADSKFEPVIPEKCKEQGYCLDEDVSYPKEYVDELLPTIPDVVDTFTIKDLTQTEPTRRSGGELCENKEQLLLPQVARDADNKLWYVLKNDQKPQGWRVMLCVNPGSDCSVKVQRGYKGTCSQKFIYQSGTVLDHDGKAVSKPLELPLTCYCKVTQTQDLSK